MHITHQSRRSSEKMWEMLHSFDLRRCQSSHMNKRGERDGKRDINLFHISGIRERNTRRCAREIALLHLNGEEWRGWEVEEKKSYILYLSTDISVAGKSAMGICAVARVDSNIMLSSYLWFPFTWYIVVSPSAPFPSRVDVLLFFRPIHPKPLQSAIHLCVVETTNLSLIIFTGGRHN